LDSPADIIKKLNKKDQELLNRILQAEKQKLHVQNVKPGSRDEKDLVAAITKLIDEVVTDAN